MHRNRQNSRNRDPESRHSSKNLEQSSKINKTGDAVHFDTSTTGSVAPQGGGVGLPLHKRVHFQHTNDNDKFNGAPRNTHYRDIEGYETVADPVGTGRNTRFIIEEHKDPNGEMAPLHTIYRNRYQSVDKDATIPKSNTSGQGNYTTNGTIDKNTNNQNHHNTIDRVYSRDKRHGSKWKVDAKNIYAIVAAVAALLICIVALLVGISHALENTNKHPSEEENQIPFTPPNFFDEVGRYIFHDYDTKTPYSDFLPGLAGIYGKPLFAFFVNRGQGIASFGVKSKNTPIMEFSSASTAYQTTPLVGFRTFIKGRRGDEGKMFLIEPFSPLTTEFPVTMMDGLGTNSPPANKRILYSGENEMQIQEIDYAQKLETNVTYFILPEEDFGAFVRRVTITNTDPKETVNISFLDGLAKMQPAGGNIGNYLKTMGRTLESFMGVYFPYEDTISMPFYRLFSKPTDSDFIEVQERGHYCVSIKEDQYDSLLPIVYDTSKVFGQDTTLLRPMELYSKSVKDIVSGPQYGKAKTSSCFAAVEDATLQPGESITITTYFGAADHILDLPIIVRRLQQAGFALYKLTRTREVIRQITTSVETKTGSEIFDAHVSQMFLDSSLRGGVPMVLGDQDDNNEVWTVDEDPRLKVFHVFSRMHGDLERDDKDFYLPSTFFSQGPGNFRGLVQNRRNDVVFNPKIGSFNIKMFLSFIQADGYEPSSVEGIVFTIDDISLCNEIAIKSVGPADGHRAQREALSGILNNGPFRPGQLFQLMKEQNIYLLVSRQEFIDMVAVVANYYPFAVYEDGFWADSWTYYLDMIQSYLTIFPEEEERVMFDVSIPYFFSPASVQPRSHKYVKNLSFNGEHDHIQQLDATIEDQAKRDHMNKFFANNIGWYEITAHWQHDESGVIFESTAYAKLFLLATLKFATRDALGMGIEYEAGRPGWDDANNGIPGMLGSGMPESFELKALIHYLVRSGNKYTRDFEIPEELYELYNAINSNLAALKDYKEILEATNEVPYELFSYWDNVSTARETYREKTRIHFSGKSVLMNHSLTVDSLKLWAREIDKGIARATSIGTRGHDDDGNSGIVPTYFAYRVTKWNATGDHNPDGHPFVTPLNMTVVPFPLFLEGPTRMMKDVDAMAARDIFYSVRNSTLYDKQLHMYTVSASLSDQPIEMGRSAAFTPGWLENQSVSLHMSYKLYLELLRQRLYGDFFDLVLEGSMLPFVDPKTYGRTPMQCSSFIVSSAFEDPSVRGRGILGRLSGSTAEFLSMWILMFIGPNPFYVDEATGDIQLELKPSIPGWLFGIHDGLSTMGGVMLEDNGTPRISFKLFSSISVHYYNEDKVDILRTPPHFYRVGLRDGTIFHFNQTFIPTTMAKMIRRVVIVDYIEAHF